MKLNLKAIQDVIDLVNTGTRIIYCGNTSYTIEVWHGTAMVVCCNGFATPLEEEELDELFI